MIKLNNKKINKLIREEIIVDNSNDKLNALKIALLNNPDAANVIIMNSNQEYIDKTIKLIESFDDIIDIQPASWYYIQDSNKFNVKLNIDDHFYGYNYKNKLKKDTIKNVTHYILEKQEMYNSIKNKCQLCEIYMNKIVFTKCKHKFCISCSIKSKVCQVCKCDCKEEEKVLY